MSSGDDAAANRIERARRDGSTVLDLRHLGLDALPASLGYLAGLTELYLGGNRLNVLPRGLGKLTELVTLDVNGNWLTELPRELSKLTKLTKLDLGHNQLTTLPDWIGNLTELTELRLDHNGLTVLPKALSNLNELTELRLDYNQLAALPDWLGDLTNLTELRLGRNLLTALPDRLGDLTRLTKLDLGHNELTALPDWFGDLTELAELRLSYNRFTALPDKLGNLTKITTLQLGHNGLTALPEALGNLTALTWLDLDGNPLISPPPEVVAGGFASVLAYLRASRERGVRQLWRSKLLLVGQGRAGKSTLVAVLDGRGFHQNQPSTVGMRLTELAIDPPELPADRLAVLELEVPHPFVPDTGVRPSMRLSVWDFGGQEVYHATHQFFLTDRSLFLVVWDTNQGYENSRLPYWLDTVTARAPGAPILLVATHGAQRPADLPLDELQARFPAIVAAVTVDSATELGIEQLRDLIAYHAARLPLMGAPWPESWAASADALQALPTAHTTLEATRSLLNGLQVIGPEQDRLLAALTVLGDVLHYPDDPRLAGTVVLRPEWLNTRIARLLDSHSVHDRGGQLWWSDIATEWADIPKDLREHFLTMMDRYDISYRVHERDSATASVITALLPWQRPDLSEHWPTDYAGRQISLSYRLSFIPPGIPTWFITRTRRFTVHHWRTGALLRDPDAGALALIEASPAGDTLRLTARGEHLDRFLPLLLAELTHSLGRYPGLTVQRSIACPLPSAPNHPPHGYHHLHLLKALLRSDATVSCPETGSDIKIRPLLAGISLDPGELAELARLAPRSELEEKLGDKLDRLESIARGTKEDTAVLLTASTEAAGTRCPRVFTVRQVRNGLLRTRYQLRVCCEYEEGWHEIEPESPGAQDAVYDLRRLHAWAHTIAPTVQGIATTAKTAAPLIGLLLGVIVPYLHGTARKEVQAARAHLHQVPGHVRLLDQVPGASALREVVTPTAFAHTDADYRQLTALFEYLDATRVARPSQGGLSATRDSTGLTVYLCPEHAPVR